MIIVLQTQYVLLMLVSRRKIREMIEGMDYLGFLTLIEADDGLNQ